MGQVGNLSGVWIPIWLFACIFVAVAIEVARTPKP